MKKVIFLVLCWMVAYGSVNAMENNCASLCEASRNGDVELVKVLLLSSNGADVNMQDENGCTPLYCAVSRDNLEIVKLLLDRRADANKPNKDGWTPLNSAAFHCYREIVKLLLNNGADANKQDNFGSAPLHGAVDYGDQETVKLILDNRADVNLQNEATEPKKHQPVLSLRKTT